MHRPIFFDPTGRRSRWSKRLVGALIIALLAAAVAFATTLVAVPREQALALPFARPKAALWQGALQRQGLGAWLPRGMARDRHTPLSIGFYVPGDDAGIASLRRHIDALDWVVPAFVSVSGPRHVLAVTRDAALDRATASAPRAKILPMVQNYGREQWDGAGAAALLRDAAQRRRLAASLGAMVARDHDAGLVMDFESLPTGAARYYLAFLGALRRALPKGTTLAVTAPAGDADWPLTAAAGVADRLILMAYDQHWEGGEPGPIAAQDWFVREVERGLRAVGPDRLIVALGSYGYDWRGEDTNALSIEEAWLAAHDSDAPVTFDSASGNAGFAYDEAGRRHIIWMMDAATSWNEFIALRRMGIDDVALWRMGSEDPGFWTDLDAFRSGGRPDLSTPRALLNADVEGTGELLRISAEPTAGRRVIDHDAQGMIRAERYEVLPTPYVVQRAGAADPKLLALTFDDGPDSTWTPLILDALERAHVPATFFVVGENALDHPALLRRIVADGDEIGNHTYTHPNLALDNPKAVKLELNATQRLVEAYTGRSMTMFRAAYSGMRSRPRWTSWRRPRSRSRRAIRSSGCTSTRMTGSVPARTKSCAR